VTFQESASQFWSGCWRESDKSYFKGFIATLSNLKTICDRTVENRQISYHHWLGVIPGHDSAAVPRRQTDLQRHLFGDPGLIVSNLSDDEQTQWFWFFPPSKALAGRYQPNSCRHCGAYNKKYYLDRCVFAWRILDFDEAYDSDKVHLFGYTDHPLPFSLPFING